MTVNSGSCRRQMEENGRNLRSLLRTYGESREPITVSFRELTSPPPGGLRTLHLLHHYPAKVLHHIPYFFIGNNVLSSPGSLIVDPFCGSGTVLLESMALGRESIGIDSNPLATLISRVKTTPLDSRKLARCAERLLARISRQTSSELPDVVNLEYWFYPHAIRQLVKIRAAIRGVRKPSYRDFFWVCFSTCVRKMSRADPRVSVPVRLKYDQYPKGHILREKTKLHLEWLHLADAALVFADIVERNLARVRHLDAPAQGTAVCKVISGDVRQMAQICSDEVDLVVTSPPYMGAQKYIRSSSLSLGWLDLVPRSKLSSYERCCIGREHFRRDEYEELQETGIPSADEQLLRIHSINPLRAHMAASYLRNMRVFFGDAVNRLRAGGHIVLVCANNSVSGEEFQTQAHLRAVSREFGLDERLVLVDTIISRGLMTRRNRTASMISREWLVVLQKT